MAQMKAEWSKSYICWPRDHLISHVHIRDKVRFRASYEKDGCRPPMSYLIGWEYARIWNKERDEFIKQRKIKSQPKRIKNDYSKWLDKRGPRILNKPHADRFRAKASNSQSS